MKKYYLHDGQNNIGPFDLQELKERGITKSTNIWYDGSSDWQKAGEVAELDSIFTPTPPPIPKVASPVSKKSNGFTIYQKIGFVMLFALLGGFVYTNLTDYRNDPGYYDENINTAVIDTAATVVSEDAGDSRRNIRNDIENLVTVSTNKYTVDPFGGISNLDIIINNTTHYKLDECVVEVHYIQDNGAVFKTETLAFNSIPSSQDESMSAPDSPRGLSVTTRIVSIRSKSLHLCYDGTVAPQVGHPDPFKCE